MEWGGGWPREARVYVCRVEAELETPPAGGGGSWAVEAERAVALMEEISADLRGCAVLPAAGGGALAASGERQVWGEAGSALLEAADAARPGGRTESVHVATEDGEAFALRQGELAMVAVTERFTLASLVVSDMRMILRDLAQGEVRDRRAPGPGVVADEVDPEAATPPAD